MAKKPAEPKRPKLLDELLAAQGKPGVPKWQAHLTSEQIEQLEEIKEAFKQGRVTLPQARIRALVNERFGTAANKTSFNDWIRA